MPHPGDRRVLKAMDAASIKDRLIALRELAVKPFLDEEEARRIRGELLEACLFMADRLGELEASQEDLTLYLEAIDEDLALLEAALNAGAEEEEEDEGETVLDLICPHCHRPILFPPSKGP